MNVKLSSTDTNVKIKKGKFVKNINSHPIDPDDSSIPIKPTEGYFREIIHCLNDTYNLFPIITKSEPEVTYKLISVDDIDFSDKDNKNKENNSEEKLFRDIFVEVVFNGSGERVPRYQIINENQIKRRREYYVSKAEVVRYLNNIYEIYSFRKESKEKTTSEEQKNDFENWLNRDGKPNNPNNEFHYFPLCHVAVLPLLITTAERYRIKNKESKLM